jgi:hypothetical protein
VRVVSHITDHHWRPHNRRLPSTSQERMNWNVRPATIADAANQTAKLLNRSFYTILRLRSRCLVDNSPFHNDTSSTVADLWDLVRGGRSSHQGYCWLRAGHSGHNVNAAIPAEIPVPNLRHFCDASGMDEKE